MVKMFLSELSWSILKRQVFTQRDQVAQYRHTPCQRHSEELRTQVIRLAIELNVVGLMNTQFAIKDNQIYLLEVNPRASRTAPFVSKSIGVQLAKVVH